MKINQGIIILAIFFFFSFTLFSSISIAKQKELTLTDGSQKALLDYARLVLDGKKDKAKSLSFSEEITTEHNSIILTLFAKTGELVLSKRIDDKKTNLTQKIDEAVKEISSVFSNYKDTYIHLMVVSYTGRFPNFGIKGLFDNKVYEPRVTGLIYELNGKRAELNPLQALALNLDSSKSRNYLARKIEIDPKKMPAMNDLIIEIYRVIHFGEAYPDKQFTQYFRGHKIFKAEDINYEVLKERLNLIGQWYSNNVVDGEVTYQYDPTQDKYYNNKRTMVRSIMSVWILNRLSIFLNDNQLKKLGEQTIKYYLGKYFNMDESLKKGEIIPMTEVHQSGHLIQNDYTTATFLIAAILEREDRDKYKKEIDLLFNWAKKYQRADGIFWTDWGQNQYFMPGQLLLAVSYLYEKTHDEKYEKFFEKSFNAYENPLYESMHLGPKGYAPYAPAWFTQPFAKMYELTKDNRYRDIVFEINDHVVKWYPMHVEYETYFDYDGVLLPKPGYYGNNSITSASLEALCDAAYVARLSGDTERYKKYSNIVRHSIAYLLRLQYTPENSYYIKKKDIVIGGFKQDLVNNLLWMDNVWHLTSAFMKVEKNRLLD